MQNEPKFLLRKEASFLTITQAAQLLKVSPDTLRRWEDKGIITPQRTKGGSRRYTLLDLKIAKLNKRKDKLFQIPVFLKQNYINSKRDLKIALLTSFLWIFGLLIYQFLPPIFLRPTNPELQISLDQLKTQTSLKNVSGEVFVLSDQTPDTNKTIPPLSESDLLIQRFSNSPTLKFSNTADQYYSLQPLPQNPIPTVIKRS